MLQNGHEESLSSVTPDQQHIPRNNKIKKTSDTFIVTNETIQEPVSPIEREKEDTITDVKQTVLKKNLKCFGIR